MNAPYTHYAGVPLVAELLQDEPTLTDALAIIINKLVYWSPDPYNAGEVEAYDSLVTAAHALRLYLAYEGEV